MINYKTMYSSSPEYETSPLNEDELLEFNMKKANEKLALNKFDDYMDQKGKRSGKTKLPRNKTGPLNRSYHTYDECINENIIEAGIDEAGRGPMFGRVYTACAVLPPCDDFKHELMKDSKRFTSKRKLMEVYDCIRENAVDYCVSYKDEKEIDSLNIRQATIRCMHDSIRGLEKVTPSFLIVDGCDFIPYRNEENVVTKYTTVEGGDNLYTCIAAASILAKVERDKYIEKMCEDYPELDEKYGLLKNKGYGTKIHIEGIKTHGITKWHRKTYGICKQFA